MIKRVRYNKDMIGTVITENHDHIVIKFDSGTTYCVLKSSIESMDYFYENPDLFPNCLTTIFSTPVNSLKYI